jgi:hypothetical protein
MASEYSYLDITSKFMPRIPTQSRRRQPVTAALKLALMIYDLRPKSDTFSKGVGAQIAKSNQTLPSKKANLFQTPGSPGRGLMTLCAAAGCSFLGSFPSSATVFQG